MTEIYLNGMEEVIRTHFKLDEDMDFNDVSPEQMGKIAYYFSQSGDMPKILPYQSILEKVIDLDEVREAARNFKEFNIFDEGQSKDISPKNIILLHQIAMELGKNGINSVLRESDGKINLIVSNSALEGVVQNA